MTANFFNGFPVTKVKRGSVTMEDFLGKIAEEILSLFKRNYRRPKLWIGIMCIAIAVILLMPYIYSNFFYFNRIEKRIEILNQVMNLDSSMIKNNAIFEHEYQAILNEMSINQERSINTVINKINNFISGISKSNNLIENRTAKFLTGALWMIILMVCVPFMNTFDKRSDKILAFFIIAILALVLGFICMVIPIVITPMVNYIGMPLIQLLIVIAIAIKSNKKKVRTVVPDATL